MDEKEKLREIVNDRIGQLLRRTEISSTEERNKLKDAVRLHRKILKVIANDLDEKKSRQ